MRLFFIRVFIYFFIFSINSLFGSENFDRFFPEGTDDDLFFQQDEELDLIHFNKALKEEDLVAIIKQLKPLINSNHIAVFECHLGTFLFKHLKLNDDTSNQTFNLFNQPNIRIEIVKNFEEESIDELMQLFEIDYLYSLRHSHTVRKIKEFEQLYFSAESLDLAGLCFFHDEYLKNKHDIIYIRKMIQAAYQGNLEAMKVLKTHFTS